MNESLMVGLGIGVVLWIVVGVIFWLSLERWEDMDEWNFRQKVYMGILHGPLPLAWIIHKHFFEWLGKPTKYEQAYKNITQ